MGHYDYLYEMERDERRKREDRDMAATEAYVSRHIRAFGLERLLAEIIANPSEVRSMALAQTAHAVSHAAPAKAAPAPKEPAAFLRKVRTQRKKASPKQKARRT